MAHGIEVRNSAGVTIIDGASPVYTQIASGTLSVDTDNGVSYEGSAPIPSGFTNWVVAYKLPEGKWLSFWKDTVFADKVTGTANVPYIVFAPTSQVTPSSDAYGLRIYSSAGNLVFDSGRATFNVLSNHIFEISVGDSDVFDNAGNAWLIPSTAGIRGLVSFGIQSGLFLTGFIYRTSTDVIRASIRPFSGGPYPIDGAPVSIPATGSAVRIAIT